MKHRWVTSRSYSRCDRDGCCIRRKYRSVRRTHGPLAGQTVKARVFSTDLGTTWFESRETPFCSGATMPRTR